mgnify:CR=1 FL=1
MPDYIIQLAHEVLKAPVTLRVDTTGPAATVSHRLYPVEQHLKTQLLLELLRDTDTESVLIFTRTKHRAKRLGEQLGKAAYRAASLQGNLSQARRQAVMNGFRDGTFQILVATDIAARGIDVTQISHVINYDMPDTADAYTHRIGRTGRMERLQLFLLLGFFTDLVAGFGDDLQDHPFDPLRVGRRREGLEPPGADIDDDLARYLAPGVSAHPVGHGGDEAVVLRAEQYPVLLVIAPALNRFSREMHSGAPLSAYMPSTFL